MVWEVVTPAVPSSADPNRRDLTHPDSEHPAGVMMDTDGDEVLRCDEHLASSPGRPTSDSHMEYDDLPELQEVQEEEHQHRAPPPLYQLAVGVSHHHAPHSHSPFPPADTRWLTQLAHIATGPQSPLLAGSPNSRSSPVHILGTSSNLHSYARPPPTLSSSAPLPSRGYGRGRRRCRTTSECGSVVSTRSSLSLSDDEDMGWSHSWPATAWHCFLKGTRLRFHRGPNVEWQDAEALDSDEEDSDVGEEMAHYRKGYGSEGLGLVEHTEIVLSGQSLLQLTFDPGAFGHSQLTAQCQLDHPFYVKNKGWSSFYPSLTVVHYGIPCYEVEVGDVCLPPGHRDAVHTDDSLVFDTFRSYDFTPLDSSAVYVLSSMARQRRTSQSSGGAVSPDRDAHQDRHSPGPSSSSHRKPPKSQNVTPAGSANATPIKCKRPMNAFMLFAKKYRVEYTQMYPGKDNRAISVLLGERWKKMRCEERRLYTMEAKALADEQKRINPDCWKRKRTNSGSQGN